MACEPEDVMAGAQSLCCIPPNLHAAVQSYLLARIRGGSMDVNEIVREAACELSCIPPGLLPRIRTYLLCRLSNTGGGVIPEPPPCDADAEAFIAAAGLTDETQIGAVCVLVRDLKTYPAVGTKYWDREILIYPFVGGNAAAHAVNLKNPGGPNDLTFNGAGLVHSNLGVKGDAVGAYCNTKYVITSLNSIRAMVYADTISTIANRMTFGCETVGGFYFRETNPMGFRVNSGTQTNFAVGPAPLGAWFMQRYEAATQKGVRGINVWTSGPSASTALPIRYLYLLANDSAGATPQGTPTNFADTRISSFSLGSPLDTGGGNSEHLEYKGIWDAFNITLGRGHP